MIHLFINGLAASAGGGLTYLRNVVPVLAATPAAKTTVAVSALLGSELRDLPSITLSALQPPAGAAQRFIWEQQVLPDIVRQSGADLLISAGNFALRKSPVPQILLARNSLYTSRDFFRDVRARRDYYLWLETHAKGALAKKSIRWADCTIAPSRAFADELRNWTGCEIMSVYHGFDHQSFFANDSPLPAAICEKLNMEEDCLRLLFVSHYNYYRNFETLFHAISLLQRGLQNRRVKLFLTCQLRSEQNPGAYHAETAASLIRRLGIEENVVELGTIPYNLLHHVYRGCDIYVTPAYAESFAHPLVEAMASELPVVASDLPVHREICQDAAGYFPPFSPEGLAVDVMRVSESPALAAEMSERGRNRSRDFSWRRHVDRIIEIGEEVVTGWGGGTERRSHDAVSAAGAVYMP